MKLEYFFSRHPVFTYQEFTRYLINEGRGNPNTHRELLAYHSKQGHLLRIRKGFYAVVPTAIASSADFIVDPYLIAGRIVNDAVLSYHTALDYHGVSYSVYNDFYYCSNSLIKPFEFQTQQFRRIAFPKRACVNNQEMFAVVSGERQGLEVKVTSLERTLVDVLDRPNNAGGWEEVWRSLESMAVIDVELAIKYSLLLDNTTTIAKVGYFFETHQSDFSVTDKQLAILEKHIPKSKHYFDSRKPRLGKYFSRWNLVVPYEIFNKNWEEQNDTF